MKICLVIIYNHNFEKNIDVLDRIYAGRFSHVYHVMPFYRGSRANVIGVYECSYQFNGYIAQASKIFSDETYSHYVFVADDMCLNPNFNESNIVNLLKLEESEGFLPIRRLLTDRDFIDWSGWGVPGVLNMASTENATEWQAFFPTPEEARKKFQSVGLDWRRVVSIKTISFMSRFLRANQDNPYKIKTNPVVRMLARWFCKPSGRDAVPLDSKKIMYPLVWGYADFFVLPQSAAVEFFRLCGIFAAMRQFVEIAIPTALTLTCKRVQTLKTTGLKADPPGEDHIRLSNVIEERYDLSYERFLSDYPHDYVYVHPIKISRWRDLP